MAVQTSLDIETDLQCHGMTKKELSTFLLGGVEGRAEVLRNLQSREYLVVMKIQADQNPRPLHQYVNELRQQGLSMSEWGIGDTEYGFVITPAKVGEADRKLVVFRR